MFNKFLYYSTIAFPFHCSYKVMYNRYALRLCAHDIAARSVTSVGLTHYGTGLTCGAQKPHYTNDSDLFPTNERGLKHTSLIAEPNTAIYDSWLPWSYFQPHKVSIQKMGVPDAKYYQRFTKKPWDLSSTEYNELIHRKRMFHTAWFGVMIFVVCFICNKGNQYAGLRGLDGYWIALPVGKPHKF